MSRTLALGVAVAVLVGVAPEVARAQNANALLVTGLAATTEPDTTQNATTEIQTLLAQLKLPFATVDNLSGVDISPFSCVLDIRFSDAPMIPADQAAYTTLLQAGQGLLLFGENSGFASRNNSIVAFATGLGGGAVAWSGDSSGSQACVSTELCAGVGANITYLAPGSFAAAGNGAFVSGSAGDSAGVVWGPADLTGAPNGRLVEMLTVNWIENTNVTPENARLMVNTITFLCGSTLMRAPVLSPSGILAVVAILAGVGAVGIWRRGLSS